MDIGEWLMFLITDVSNFSGANVPIKISGSDKRTGVWRYELTMQLVDGEMVTISPSASVSLFSPQHLQLKGATDCINISKPIFRAEKGLVISGE